MRNMERLSREPIYIRDLWPRTQESEAQGPHLDLDFSYDPTTHFRLQINLQTADSFFVTLTSYTPTLSSRTITSAF